MTTISEQNNPFKGILHIRNNNKPFFDKEPSPLKKALLSANLVIQQSRKPTDSIEIRPKGKVTQYNQLRQVTQITQQKIQAITDELRNLKSVNEETRLERIYDDIDLKIEDIESSLKTINQNLKFLNTSIDPFRKAKMDPSHLIESAEKLELQKNHLETLLKELKSDLENVRKKCNSYQKSDMTTYHKIVKSEREELIFSMDDM